jgi:hypothetical protein
MLPARAAGRDGLLVGRERWDGNRKDGNMEMGTRKNGRR